MNRNILVAFGAIIVGLGLYYYAGHRGDSLPEVNNSSMSTTTQNEVDALLSQKTSGSSVNQAGKSLTPVVTALPYPNLDAPLAIKSSGMSDEVLTAYQNKYKTAITSLKTDKNNATYLIVLGTVKKAVGDYAGAEEAWNYASALSPKNLVPYNNLADLYQFFLKDNVKAEANLKRVIALDPQYESAYANLSLLYHTLKKDDMAVNTLKDGLTKNPDSMDLMVNLAQFYRDLGDKMSAKTAYDTAIAQAKKLGEQALADQLTVEQSKL